MRFASTKHRVGGSRGILPWKIWNFALQEMQSSVKSQFINILGCTNKHEVK